MKRTIAAIALCALMACACFLAACQGQSAPKPEEGSHLTIVSLKGPTSIGLAGMMDAGSDLYSFEVEGTADAIVAPLMKGEVDIALVPANLAATLYQRTSGGIKVIDVNTKGVLYAVSQGDALEGVADLRGATLYMTGKGTVPQYTLDALLAAADMAEDDLTIEFRSEPAEVVAALKADSAAIGILPQPYVTAATKADERLHVVLDLTEQWSAVLGSQAGELLTGVTIVRADVLEQYPNAVATFLADHAASADSANKDPKKTAEIVSREGVIDNAAVVEAAIPDCNIVCLTGADMKTALSGYLETLYDVAPAAVGGALPDDGFYYVP